MSSFLSIVSGAAAFFMGNAFLKGMALGQAKNDCDGALSIAYSMSHGRDKTETIRTIVSTCPSFTVEKLLEAEQAIGNGADWEISKELNGRVHKLLGININDMTQENAPASIITRETCDEALQIASKINWKSLKERGFEKIALNCKTFSPHERLELISRLTDQDIKNLALDSLFTEFRNAGDVHNAGQAASRMDDPTSKYSAYEKLTSSYRDNQCKNLYLGEDGFPLQSSLDRRSLPPEQKFAEELKVAQACFQQVHGPKMLPAPHTDL